MHPVLVRLGPLSLPTYGTLVALGAWLGMALAERRASAWGVDPRTVNRLCAWLLLAVVGGGRLWFVAEHLSHYRHRPWEAIMLWRGGMVFYGGMLLGAGTMVWFCRRHRLSPWTVADLLAPPVALGHAIGRLGCLCAGCCYGKPTGLPWGVTFTHPRSLGPLGVKLHPTQLYEALLELANFLGLQRLRDGRGRVALLYGLLYGVERFGIEFLRGDPRPRLWGAPLPQLLSGALALGCAAALLVRRTRCGGGRSCWPS